MFRRERRDPAASRAPAPRPRRSRRGRRLLAAALTVLTVWACGEAREDDVPDPASPEVTIALPGAAPYPPDLVRRLTAAVRARGPGYTPRTRHRRSDGGPTYTNRLILESSPYLHQHAHNPVDWHPWGDEAFARARAENKPVLLSVGYATCHWCHVMEEESFEDEEIARLLNERYVAIKVDREQRPDVDAVYMAAVQTMTGQGGWPMTVWLTADRRPFYGGTYFPPRDGVRGARVGFARLLATLADAFRDKPAEVAGAAGDLTDRVRRSLAPAPGGDAPTAAPLHAAYAALREGFDAEHGGFGGAPKFPRSVTLDFLLRYHRRTGAADALEMVVRTLEHMAAGGLYDHIGGGFHRYATDRVWLVPHFEKMLYDNALLTMTYLEAYQATGREDFARVAGEILRYVGREMTAPEGGFYSATDADSEGVEGKFFVWTPADLEAVLGRERARLVGAYYGVTAGGNFEGANVLHTPRTIEAVAAAEGVAPAALRATLEEARDALYRARLRRVPPLTDRKILASWNGLMISAFARAALVLPGGDGAGGEPYAAAGARAAEFLLRTLRARDRLGHMVFEGRAAGAGFLDDYAFLAAGLLDLYEATAEPRWLEEAIGLHRILERRFWDAAHGGFFMTSDDGEALLAREKPDYDGAEPSGNSVAVLNLLRLHELTTDDRYREMADATLRALGGVLVRSPVAVPRLLAALDFRLDRPKAIVLVSPGAGPGEEALLARLRGIFLPNRVLAIVRGGAVRERLQTLVPLVADKTAQDGQATAYVCENRACALPTSDPDVFARQLTTREPLPAS